MFAVALVCLMAALTFTVAPAIANTSVPSVFAKLDATPMSNAELGMVQAEVWGVAIRIIGGKLIVKFGPRVYIAARHGAHHAFKWIGKQPHFQITKYIEKISGSGRNFRFPIKFWK
jgi:hypothetical protein